VAKEIQALGALTDYALAGDKILHSFFSEISCSVKKITGIVLLERHTHSAGTARTIQVGADRVNEFEAHCIV
jgi:hypothetical protein